MYIAKLMERGCEVTVYIINGFQTRGVIIENKADHIVLAGANKDRMIYKHAISTIEPV